MKLESLEWGPNSLWPLLAERTASLNANEESRSRGLRFFQVLGTTAYPQPCRCHTGQRVTNSEPVFRFFFL